MMADIEKFRQLALSLDETTEELHFDKISFRIKKKIFATLDTGNNTAVVKLSLPDQSVFCAFDKNIIYPVNGTWGKQGWTIVVLQKILEDMLQDLLTTAYCSTAPTHLAEKYKLP